MEIVDVDGGFVAVAVEMELVDLYSVEIEGEVYATVDIDMVTDDAVSSEATGPQRDRHPWKANASPCYKGSVEVVLRAAPGRAALAFWGIGLWRVSATASSAPTDTPAGVPVRAATCRPGTTMDPHRLGLCPARGRTRD